MQTFSPSQNNPSLALLIMIFFKFFFFSSLLIVIIRGEITPYQPPDPNGGQSPNPQQPNQQTPVNQAIRIREPVDRPPELPSKYLIQHNEPPPRYERPSMWQRLRGNRGNQENSNKDKNKGKGKMNEKDENHSSILGKRKRPEGGTHDNEAGPSGTKPVPEPEPEKKKGFWRKVWEGSDDDRRRRRRRRYYYYRTKEERERDAKAGEAILGLIGSAVYGVYQGTKAVVEGVYEGGKYVGNKVKDGCNAACRAAKNKARGVKNRILRRPNPVNDNHHHVNNHHNVNNYHNVNYYQHQHAQHQHQHAQHQHQHAQHYIQYHPVPQPSLSTHSASHFGATIANERSVNQYRGHDRGVIIARSSDSGGSSRSHSVNAHAQTSSSSSSSSASSMSISSRSASPTHSSGTSVSRGSSSIRRHHQQHPGQ